MKKYIPFLKMKQNEVAAVSALKKEYRDLTTPFFDIPRPKECTEEQIVARIEIAKRQADKHLNQTEFYLDNYDVDDSVKISGAGQYQAILAHFEGHEVIPVVALNRDATHNGAALAFASERNGKIAIRLTAEDVESYRITRPELSSLYSQITASKINSIDLIIDFRILTEDENRLAKSAASFVEALERDYLVHRMIIAGSSIPASVRDLLKTKNSKSIARKEWRLWTAFGAAVDRQCQASVIYGDYGVVSPDYTDLEMDFAVVQNVAAPKAFYTYEGNYFLVRGGAFKTHPKGYKQYYAIADELVQQRFFRRPNFSFGEKYIHDRSEKVDPRAATSGSPGSWLKATLVSHMTFIIDSL